MGLYIIAISKGTWHNDQAKLEHLHYNYFVGSFFFFTKVKNTDDVDTALVMLKLSLSTVIAGEFELGILKGIISIAY